MTINVLVFSQKPMFFCFLGLDWKTFQVLLQLLLFHGQAIKAALLVVQQPEATVGVGILVLASKIWSFAEVFAGFSSEAKKKNKNGKMLIKIYVYGILWNFIMLHTVLSESYHVLSSYPSTIFILHLKRHWKPSLSLWPQWKSAVFREQQFSPMAQKS